MKAILPIFAFSIISTAGVSAVTYTLIGGNLTNVSNDTIVTDNAGNALAAGGSIAAIGYFETFTDVGSMESTDIDGQAFGDLAGDFVVLASNLFDVTGAIGETLDGFFSISEGLETDTNPLIAAGANRTLYLFFGNSSDLNSATEIALVDTGESVISDFSGDPPFNSEASITVGTVIIGNEGGSQTVSFFGSDLATTGSLALVTVPEPSTAAVLTLGGFALLLRRRR